MYDDKENENITFELYPGAYCRETHCQYEIDRFRCSAINTNDLKTIVEQLSTIPSVSDHIIIEIDNDGFLKLIRNNDDDLMVVKLKVSFDVSLKKGLSFLVEKYDFLKKINTNFQCTTLIFNVIDEKLEMDFFNDTFSECEKTTIDFENIYYNVPSATNNQLNDSISIKLACLNNVYSRSEHAVNWQRDIIGRYSKRRTSLEGYYFLVDAENEKIKWLAADGHRIVRSVKNIKYHQNVDTETGELSTKTTLDEQNEEEETFGQLMLIPDEQDEEEETSELFAGTIHKQTFENLIPTLNKFSVIFDFDTINIEKIDDKVKISWDQSGSYYLTSLHEIEYEREMIEKIIKDSKKNRDDQGVIMSFGYSNFMKKFRKLSYKKYRHVRCDVIDNCVYFFAGDEYDENLKNSLKLNDAKDIVEIGGSGSFYFKGNFLFECLKSMRPENPEYFTIAIKDLSDIRSSIYITFEQSEKNKANTNAADVCCLMRYRKPKK